MIAGRRCIFRLAEHLDWLITVEFCITLSGLLSFPLNASVLRAFVHRSPWIAPAELALLLLLSTRVAVDRSDDHYVTRLKRSSGWKWMPQILQLSTGRLHVDELSVNEVDQCMLVINRRRRKLPRYIVLNGVGLLAALNLLRLMGSSYENIVAVTAWCVGVISLIATAIVTSLLFRRAGRLISAASGES
jgi:hypothetical protein